MLIALALVALLSQGCAVGRYFYDRGRDLTDCVRVEAGLGPGLGVQAKGAGILDAGLVVASTPRRSAVAWNYGRGHIGGMGDMYPGTGWDNTVDWSLPVVAASAGLIIGGAAGGAAIVEHGGASAGEAAVYTVAGTGILALTPVILANNQREGRGGSRGTPGWTLAWESYATEFPDLNWRHADKQSNAYLPAYYSWVRPDDPKERHGSWLWRGRTLRYNRRAHVHAFDLEASVWAGVGYGRVGFSVGEFADFVTGIFGADLARDDWHRRSDR